MLVDLQVLGPLRMVVDGRVVELGPERRRSVLAALAVDLGRVVSFDVLADRVWNGRPPPNASGTVHAYISRLRSSLRSYEQDGTELPSPLLTHAPGYRLDLPPEASDAHRFEVQVAQARSALDTDEVGAAARLLRGALALWRDEAYLDVRADFARQEAGRLRDARLAAHELAVRADLRRGMHAAVLSEIHALLVAEPFREGLHGALMLALYRSGRQAEALDHFAGLRDRLADELGLDPGPETRRLHEQILRQDPALDVPTAPITVAEPTVDSAIAESLVTGGRLVGREGELERIDTLLRARFGDDPRSVAVAVVGEAGIGKTRLLEEVAARASRRGVRVAWGRCWQHEGAPLFWPWIQALEVLAEQLPAAELDAALQGRGSGVAALLPHLHAGAAEVAAPASPDAVRVRLYAAVAHFLAVAARTGPVLLVLEDVHWADLASRELAEYVVGQPPAAAVGLLVTVRSPTEDSARVGSELLTSWARSGRTERVDLAGLPPSAISDYVADRTGDVLDRATAEALADRTGGNPFFVAELVRLLVTDVAAKDRGRALSETVPDSIRDVIARRVERLPKDHQTVLRVAAAVGRTFDLDLLQTAASLPADLVDEAVDRATELGILSSEPDEVGRHRFVHALTQQTLLETTGPARLRRLHEQVAKALDTARGDAEPDATEAERLAFHLARAGGRLDLERACDLCLLASDEVLAAGNYPETESLLLRALDLTGRLSGDGAGPREMAARVRLWSLYTMTGGPGRPEAAGQQERALALIERYGGAREIMAGHEAAFSRLAWFADLDGAERLLQEMSAAAETADNDLMRIAVHIGRAEVLVSRNRATDAIAELEALTPYAAVLHDTPPGVFVIEPATEMHIWRGLALALLDDRTGSAAEAAAAERAMQGAPATTVAYGQILLAVTAAVLDDPAAARRAAEAAQSLTLRHGLAEADMFLAPLLAWSKERLEPGPSLPVMEQAMELTKALPTMGYRTGLYAMLADVQLRAGAMQSALASIRTARAEAATTGEHLFLAWLNRLEAAAAVSQGTCAALAAEDGSADKDGTRPVS